MWLPSSFILCYIATLLQTTVSSNKLIHNYENNFVSRFSHNFMQNIYFSKLFDKSCGFWPSC